MADEADPNSIYPIEAAVLEDHMFDRIVPHRVV